jgi:uncharacterized membrane protein
LVFALLPAKSEDCYIKMWDLLIAACRERKQGHEGMFFCLCIMIPLDEKYIIQNLNYEF